MVVVSFEGAFADVCAECSNVCDVAAVEMIEEKPQQQGTIVGDLGASTGLQGGVEVIRDGVDNNMAEDAGEKFRCVGLVGILFCAVCHRKAA